MASPRGRYPRRLPLITRVPAAPVSPLVLPPVVVRSDAAGEGLALLVRPPLSPLITPRLQPAQVIRGEDAATPGLVWVGRTPGPPPVVSGPIPRPAQVIRGEDVAAHGMVWLARPPGPAPVVSGPSPQPARVVRSADPDVPGVALVTRPQPPRVQPLLLPPQVVRSDGYVEGQAQAIRPPLAPKVNVAGGVLPPRVLRFEPPAELLAGFVLATPTPPPAPPAPPPLKSGGTWLVPARGRTWQLPARGRTWQAPNR